MNKNNLYYKRGMHTIDKLLKTFQNDSTFYKNRMELLKSELRRMNTNSDIVNKDIDSFSITVIAALFGLNKENIENMNKHGNYFLSEFNEQTKLAKDLESFKTSYPEFESSRKIITEFDDWLSVENCDYPTLSYMMNIRNGILHSEYEPNDSFGDLLSITNSNYTHFKAKVITVGLLDFCLFYFGNNTWSGLTENFNIYEIDCNKKIDTEEELKKQLKTIKIIKLSYNKKDDKTSYRLPEVKAYEFLEKINNNKNHDITLNQLLDKIFSKKYDYSVDEKNLTENQIETIKKMVDKYYGKQFYEWDSKYQNKQLQMLTRYLVDSRSTLSEWICDFVDFFNYIRYIFYNNSIENIDEIEKQLENMNSELNRRSVFACRTSLLIIKLYQILYRLQNKKYEEIDYNNINFDLLASDYTYTRKDVDGSITHTLNIDKAKIQSKNASLSDKEAENKAICEIIRDALSHGNVEMNFKIESDELKEYIVFEDIYHSKSRKLEITLDKLESFLKSDAFTTANCIIKETDSKAKIL